MFNKQTDNYSENSKDQIEQVKISDGESKKMF